jgi:ferritin-like metal-binding protein YciE
MNSLQVLLEESIRELYFGEQQLAKAIPEWAGYASSLRLKEVLMAHLLDTQHQFRRLEIMVQHLDINLTGKKCRAMEGLIAHGRAAVREAAQGGAIDAAVVGAVQGVGQYEMACYGVTQPMAETLQHQEVALLLQLTLDEEIRAGKTFGRVAEEEILARGGSASRPAKEYERRWKLHLPAGVATPFGYASRTQDWI